MPKIKAYYDLTRLVGRADALYPTGVDRVDLHYALWMREQSEVIVWGLQTRRGFVLLSSLVVDDLLRRLYARWLDGAKGLKVLRDESLNVVGLEGRSSKGERRALLEKFRRVGFCELWRERGFWAALASRLPCRQREVVFPDGDWSDWTYVNVGHCFRFEAALESLPAEMKRLYFLHDVIPLTHPETQKATSRAHFRKFCEYVGHSMSDVIVSSQATVDAIASLPGDDRELLDSVASIQVAPLAVEERFKTERLEGCKVGEWQSYSVAEFKSGKGTELQSGKVAEGLHGKGTEGECCTDSEGAGGTDCGEYFLSVGTVEPRKNLELLVRVWEKLIKSGQDIPKLIWVGKFGWSCDEQLMRRFKRLEKMGHVELRSGVEDEELTALMAGAIALLFPSKIEGWGLPLSEALSMGVPVIASDIAVFREVGQGVPDLIALDDVGAWHAAIRAYSELQSALRAEQMLKIKHYQPVTWEQHFAGVHVAKR